eukprot:g181.t1
MGPRAFDFSFGTEEGQFVHATGIRLEQEQKQRPEQVVQLLDENQHGECMETSICTEAEAEAQTTGQLHLPAQARTQTLSQTQTSDQAPDEAQLQAELQHYYAFLIQGLARKSAAAKELQRRRQKKQSQQLFRRNPNMERRPEPQPSIQPAPNLMVDQNAKAEQVMRQQLDWEPEIEPELEQEIKPEMELERRAAPDGTGYYTRNEFVAYYGGTYEWDAAVGVDASTATAWHTNEGETVHSSGGSSVPLAPRPPAYLPPSMRDSAHELNQEHAPMPKPPHARSSSPRLVLEALRSQVEIHAKRCRSLKVELDERNYEMARDWGDGSGVRGAVASDPRIKQIRHELDGEKHVLAVLKSKYAELSGIDCDGGGTISAGAVFVAGANAAVSGVSWLVKNLIGGSDSDGSDTESTCSSANETEPSGVHSDYM